MEGAAGLRWGRNREKRILAQSTDLAWPQFSSWTKGECDPPRAPQPLTHPLGPQFLPPFAAVGVPAWERRAQQSALPSPRKGAGTPTAPPSLGPESRD